MEQSSAAQPQELRKFLEDFLAARSLQPQTQQICRHCGAVMRYASFVLWLDGADAGWILNLPLCNCGGTFTPPSEIPRRFAA